MALLTTTLDCTSPIQTVVVGQDPSRRFFLHHNILCQSSELFQSTPISEVVRLPECHPHAFELYSIWLYTGRGTVPLAHRDRRTGKPSWPYLARAYALGEEIQDCKFKDSVIDCMYRLSAKFDGGTSDSRKAVTTIYYNTDPSSPARLLMVHLYTANDTWEWLDGRAYIFPHKFLFDLAQTLALVKNGEPVPQVSESPCAYHSHAIDVENGSCPHDAVDTDCNVTNKKRRRITANAEEGIF